ncbi:hypothetical protein AA313_de0206768 [Arthrobotrys entomopaga]|nr:hypothetical protein AA313_de0206768 [Arthrobotrys entomopaga]
MEAQAQNNVQLLTTLVRDPDTENYDQFLDEFKERILKGDKALDHAAKSVKKAQSKPTTRFSIFSWIWNSIIWVITQILAFFGFVGTWSNYIGEQTCYPGKIRYPKRLKDIVRAVNDARQRKITVRAVGSGHSYSNVAPVFKGGILLNPKHMSKVLPVDKTILRDPSSASKLFAVESGITIQALNAALDKKNLALANMGAYDGQTLAGAISTGTHGTGIGLGPLASSVRAIVLVSGTGTVYHIESSKGISDPAKFNNKVQDRTLRQDDDWFNTALVSMGCTGIIYSYILEVVDAYFLEEVRKIDSWENVKKDLEFQEPGVLPAVLTTNRHYEVDINPYAVKDTHSCVVQKKNIVPKQKPTNRGPGNWIAGILASWPLAQHWLVWALNLWPTVSPELINKALNSLLEGGPYIDKSFNVLNLGPVNNVKAIAMELSYPLDENLVNEIDGLLLLFQEQAEKMNWYMAGPFSLRFVAASDAYLAPQQGRPTCMVEMDMLLGIKSGTQLLKEITKRVQASNPRMRVHWGLDLDTVQKDGNNIEILYPGYSNWLKVYYETNTMGIFDNPFTDRLGISVNVLA